jgi:hypothetical protein
VLLTPREVVSALRVDLSLVRLSASPKPPARRKEVPADHEAAVTACASPAPGLGLRIRDDGVKTSLCWRSESAVI